MFDCNPSNVIVDAYVGTAVAHIQSRTHLNCIEFVDKAAGAWVLRI
jgi:hypothetical protein